jgi:hypothetical protein
MRVIIRANWNRIGPPQVGLGLWLGATAVAWGLGWWIGAGIMAWGMQP